MLELKHLTKILFSPPLSLPPPTKNSTPRVQVNAVMSGINHQASFNPSMDAKSPSACCPSHSNTFGLRILGSPLSLGSSCHRDEVCFGEPCLHFPPLPDSLGRSCRRGEPLWVGLGYSGEEDWGIRKAEPSHSTGGKNREGNCCRNSKKGRGEKHGLEF